MDYIIGDIVEFTIPGEGYVQAVVTSRSPDVKDGRPGFGGLKLGSAEPVWGFDDEIREVFPDTDD